MEKYSRVGESSHFYLLIVPCFNEVGRLQKEQFFNFLNSNSNFDILFVNDGSSDGTKELLEEISKEHPNARFLDLDRNVGKAAAIREGVLESDVSKYTYVGYADADLATPLREIEKIFTIASREDYHFVMGTRFQRLGSHIVRKHSRHYLGRVFATFASLILGLRVYDTQCGAKAIRSDLVKELFAEPFITRWLFDVELLARIKNHPKYELEKLYELPLKHWEDVEGTKLKIFDFLKAPYELLRIYLKY